MSALGSYTAAVQLLATAVITIEQKVTAAKAAATKRLQNALVADGNVYPRNFSAGTDAAKTVADVRNLAAQYDTVKDANVGDLAVGLSNSITAAAGARLSPLGSQLGAGDSAKILSASTVAAKSVSGMTGAHAADALEAAVPGLLESLVEPLAKSAMSSIASKALVNTATGGSSRSIGSPVDLKGMLSLASGTMTKASAIKSAVSSLSDMPSLVSQVKSQISLSGNGDARNALSDLGVDTGSLFSSIASAVSSVGDLGYITKLLSSLSGFIGALGGDADSVSMSDAETAQSALTAAAPSLNDLYALPGIVGTYPNPLLGTPLGRDPSTGGINPLPDDPSQISIEELQSVKDEPCPPQEGDPTYSASEIADAICSCADAIPATVQLVIPAVAPSDPEDLPAIPDDQQSMLSALDPCSKSAATAALHAQDLATELAAIQQWLADNERTGWYQQVRVQLHQGKRDGFESAYAGFIPGTAPPKVDSPDFGTVSAFSNELREIASTDDYDVSWVTVTPLQGTITKYGDALQALVDSYDLTVQGAAAQLTAAVDPTREAAIAPILQAAKSAAYSFGNAKALEIFAETGGIGYQGNDDRFLKDLQDAQADSDAFQSVLSSKENRRTYIQSYLSGLGDQMQATAKANGCFVPEPTPATDAGSDPDYRGNPNVDSPNCLGMNWWLKFCELATLMNLIPVHWPIGLLIPNPSGILRVPMPIVWVPVVVIPIPVGFVVVMAADCGACVAPAVFMYNSSGEPLGTVQARSCGFPIAVRPESLVKSNPGSDVLGAVQMMSTSLGNVDLSPETTASLPYVKDDFPSWERLSLDNPPFCLFLWDFCAAGKKSQGFFQNP